MKVVEALRVSPRRVGAAAMKTPSAEFAEGMTLVIRSE